MSKTSKFIGFVLVGAVAVTATGVIYEVRRRKELRRRRLEDAAEEGYETAHDIIFPTRKSSKEKDLRYGPIY